MLIYKSIITEKESESIIFNYLQTQLLISQSHEDDFPKFKPTIRMWSEGDLSGFGRGEHGCWCQAFEQTAADLLEFPQHHNHNTRVYREWAQKDKISSREQFSDSPGLAVALFF